VRFRGNWNDEWAAYSPDAKQIATSFTAGINAYIDSLDGKWPIEFRVAGFAPGKWIPEDTAARIAGLLQATSLPFIVTAAEIGVSVGAIAPVTAAALVSAGLLSVVVFPPIALARLRALAGDRGDGALRPQSPSASTSRSITSAQR
jgi:hypothetical protein